MTQAFEKEFETIDLFKNSGCPTANVDAFSLAWIKAERQMRKLFTFVIFQATTFQDCNIQELKSALAENHHVSIWHFRYGLNEILDTTVEELVGANYTQLLAGMNEANNHRNKIFHGQLTLDSLGNIKLASSEELVRSWCENLANGAHNYLGYDGFDRNSFRKQKNKKLSDLVTKQIGGIDDYKTLIKRLKTN